MWQLKPSRQSILLFSSFLDFSRQLFLFKWQEDSSFQAKHPHRFILHLIPSIILTSSFRECLLIDGLYIEVNRRLKWKIEMGKNEVIKWILCFSPLNWTESVSASIMRDAGLIKKFHLPFFLPITFKALLTDSWIYEES